MTETTEIPIGTAFPMRLYAMLEAEDAEIVSWSRSGTAFRVHNVYRFREETLPKYYRHNKITSFQRQLNLYGFKRLHKGEDAGSYSHAGFVRGRKERVRDMTRVSSRSESKRSKKMTKYNVKSQMLSTMVRINNDAPAPATNIVKRSGVSISLLGKSNPHKSEELVEVSEDVVREAQFKSSFHQTTYGWRKVLKNTEPEADTVEESTSLSIPVLEADEDDQQSIIADADATTETPTEYAMSDDLFDFDKLFGGVNGEAIVDANGEIFTDDELVDILNRTYGDPMDVNYEEK